MVANIQTPNLDQLRRGGVPGPGARTHRRLRIVGIPPKGVHADKTLLLRKIEVAKLHVVS